MPVEPPPHLRVDAGAEVGQQALDLELRVPDVQVPHRRELRHPLPVLAHGLEHDPVLRPERANSFSRAAISMLTARRLTSHSHGPGQRLVEVVDVEDEPALGGRVEAEVGEVGVATNCTSNPVAVSTTRSDAMISAATTEEGEGRCEHAAVADRHELGYPRVGLALEQVDRIGPVGCRLEDGVARARRRAPGRFAPGHPLGHAQRRWAGEDRIAGEGAGHVPQA